MCISGPRIIVEYALLDVLPIFLGFVYLAGYSLGLTNILGNDGLGKYKALDDRNGGVE